MRIINSDILFALEQRRLVRRQFVKLECDEGTFGFWDDLGEVSVGDDPTVYVGSGTLASISPFSAVSDLSIPNVDITLSGIDTDVLSTMDQYTWHQRPASISMGLLDPDTRELVGELVPWFRGFMDSVKRTGQAGGVGSLVLTLESHSRELTRWSPRVRSDSDQRKRLSTDTFYQFTSQAGTRTVLVKQVPVQPASAHQQSRGLLGLGNFLGFL